MYIYIKTPNYQMIPDSKEHNIEIISEHNTRKLNINSTGLIHVMNVHPGSTLFVDTTSIAIIVCNNELYTVIGMTLYQKLKTMVEKKSISGDLLDIYNNSKICKVDVENTLYLAILRVTTLRNIPNHVCSIYSKLSSFIS